MFNLAALPEVDDKPTYDLEYFEQISSEVTHESVIKKLYDADSKEPFTDQEIIHILKPSGASMLIRLFVPSSYKGEKTKGGIILVDKKGAEDSEKARTTYGKILAYGSQCFEGEQFSKGPYSSVGDWINFDKYECNRLPNIRGVTYGTMYDDKTRVIISEHLIKTLALNWTI